MKSSIVKYLVLFVISTELGFAFDIERRKDQYRSTPAYLLAPAPYSIPGIGKGLFLLGMANNINNTQTDFLADIITGDVSGYGVGIMEWYLIDKHLKLDIFQEGLNKATFQSYATRGMSSDKEDYIYIGVDNMKFTGVRATASFYEKMLEFYLMARHLEYRIRLQYKKLSPKVIRDLLLGVQTSINYDTVKKIKYAIPSKIKEETKKIYKIMGITRTLTPWIIGKL